VYGGGGFSGAIAMNPAPQAIVSILLVPLALVGAARVAHGDEPQRLLVLKPDLFTPLTEPPCSYCSTQHRKGLVRDDDPALAWIRGAHNGGAIPVRHFLAGPRIINDTYGLFFYDPDGGYIAAYQKDYGYTFHGWRGGVMVARARDGTLFSALSGVAFEGPQKGKKLTRIPSLATTWGHWRMLHPESTAYDLFDGSKYAVSALPTKMNPDAEKSIGTVDQRLAAGRLVHGIEVGDRTKAYALPPDKERACFTDRVDDKDLAIFWYGPTKSSVAFEAALDGRKLTFYADEISPETAPFKDKETGTRWSLAGRGIDGPLRGKELTWVPGVQAKWYAWSGEYPQTGVYEAGK
jgi:hypothetical protein